MEGVGWKWGHESLLSAFACVQNPETGVGCESGRVGRAVLCKPGAPESPLASRRPLPSRCDDAAVVGGGSCTACSHSPQVARQSFLFMFRWCKKSNKPFYRR